MCFSEGPSLFYGLVRPLFINGDSLMHSLGNTMKDRARERSSLTQFFPAEASDYPIRSRRYIAFERTAASFLLKQDVIEPNHITYFRFGICLLFILFYSRLSYLQILILAALGGISDFFDGALARAASKKTRLGMILDPLADKFLKWKGGRD